MSHSVITFRVTELEYLDMGRFVKFSIVWVITDIPELIKRRVSHNSLDMMSLDLSAFFTDLLA